MEEFKRREITFDTIDSTFGKTATDGWTCTLWTILFMGITISIVAGGVSAGIERTCRILMPTLFALICTMVVYGMFQPGFGDAIDFVFRPDASKLKPSGVLEALGHAFFTLSLGMGAMITYGSYQQSKTGLFKEVGDDRLSRHADCPAGLSDDSFRSRSRTGKSRPPDRGWCL